MLRSFALASVVTLAFTWAQASAQDAWETVRSKLGQFTVEMPSKPTINQSRVRKGTGGDVKTVLLGCKTDGGSYFAYKVILPTAIVKGTENEELDAERDGMAKEWNGKVISEERIRAGDKVGRDFTIRGKPEKGEGTVTIRVREYLSGKAVYVNFEEFEGAARGASHNEVMKGGDCWVRMERKGSRIHGSISFDGKTWKELKPIQTVWPTKLKVGVSATSSSNQPFSAAFEEFEWKGKAK